MENASKALIMAGSVLISILIISALVFMFNQLRGVKTTEIDSDEAKKLVQFNKQIETFNRSLYGSELLSLCNLIDDYNKRQADIKGYTPIKIEIRTKGIASAQKMKDNYINENSSYKDILKDFEELQDELDDAKNEVVLGERIEKWAGMKRAAQIQLLLQKGKTQQDAIDIVDGINGNLLSEIEKYNNLKSELTEFKNKKFSKPTYEYDSSTGSVSKIIFKEQGL